MHDSTSRRRFAFFAGLLGLAAFATGVQPSSAAYVVSPYRAPGAEQTMLYGINDSGHFVGQALVGVDTFYGFVHRGGTLTRLDGPAGALGSGALGISNSGAVSGIWVDGTSTREVEVQEFDPVTQQQVVRTVTMNVSRGFIYEQGAYSSFTVPFGDALNTTPRSMSSDGRYVAGMYALVQGRSGGFVLDRTTGQFTDLPDNQGYRVVSGVNSSGQVVGDTWDRQGFVYDVNTGQLSTFSLPGVRLLAPRAVNDGGQMTGWLAPFGGTQQPYVGTVNSYEALPPPAASAWLGAIGGGINNLGQIAGQWWTGDATAGFIATPSLLPTSTEPDGGFRFDVEVFADQPIFIDPLVATGYVYQTGVGDPLFKTVSLPVGIGDGLYVLRVLGQEFILAENDVFDFTLHGFADGVSRFEVAGIEPSALIDPNDPQAFVTRLTFMGNGRFTGTQVPVTTFFDASVPEPESMALLVLGLALLVRSKARTAHRR